jgi:uncharacterized membrane protein YccC
VKLRLYRLSTRVEEFGVYANGLAWLIDGHGTDDEFINRIDRELETLGSSLAAVREQRHSELADVARDVSRVEGRLEEAAEETAAETDRLEDRISTADRDDGAALRRTWGRARAVKPP